MVGDDQHVRVWNMSSLKCVQALYSAKWRQITSMAWIRVDPPMDRVGLALCIGTGTGAMTLCSMKGTEKVRCTSQDTAVH